MNLEVFEGVELKHIITSKDTNGEYSYHLVRIVFLLLILYKQHS